ncbi:hypothetical protein HAX54_037742 [Datura stramonium]|uniref:Uncharacterized protein n=1 Tax=Datura stramonium TaxID=4076 RepID=A0ABS8VJI8_DATST|nr:hypothetical protein [Datura stramonium]
MDSSLQRKEKAGLRWREWLEGWYRLTYETLFQKINARHLQDPLHLPPLNGLHCIVTGATSGIGLEIARQLAESGAHIVMAVRNTNLAHQLIQKWQRNETDSRPLTIDVLELDLFYLKSVVKFAQEWNSRSKPLHVLINNAGIYSIGQPQKFSKDGAQVQSLRTNADILKYCGKLKAEEWPVCAFIGCHCRTTKPSKEAYNVATSHQVWEKTLEMVGLPTDVVDMILQGKEIHCHYAHGLTEIIKRIVKKHMEFVLSYCTV